MTPYRITFWQIEKAWLFYVLAALAAGIFLAGMAAHICVWKKSARSLEGPFSWEALKRTILDTLLGRRVLHGDMAAGIMHLFPVFGFFIPFHRHRFAVYPRMDLFILKRHYLYSFFPGHGGGGDHAPGGDYMGTHP